MLACKHVCLAPPGPASQHSLSPRRIPREAKGQDCGWTFSQWEKPGSKLLISSFRYWGSELELRLSRGLLYLGLLRDILTNSSVGKESASNFWVRKILWRRDRLPTPVFWPGEIHGLHSPWGCKESDTTEQLSLFWSVRIKNMSRIRNKHVLLRKMSEGKLCWILRCKSN